MHDTDRKQLESYFRCWSAVLSSDILGLNYSGRWFERPPVPLGVYLYE